MIQKFSLFLLFALLFFSSCYTITHPEPCPGLTEVQFISDNEIAFDLQY